MPLRENESPLGVSDQETRVAFSQKSLLEIRQKKLSTSAKSRATINGKTSKPARMIDSTW
jgi:hypothetical protein